ncbi:tRNA uridine-5-carboxymethylaminomethyl(34) synthesis GTPase MnmE [Wielerella bovis]|uniref:tRNA uridine-5-carboxymethylaminomethyl(34) synthesis GTPase MnmE n=1 Tax=Wielerella bovis TaxID=2917790 RepID=UPI0020195A31|nr:tRNA uridine-5-carboxymethylaminomethyl(34) synthesis GTPase MnmE [Wielerella bovis]ULJ62658.1 tRNA uridine-5-carboxymethylaminomethyl(34) synthesis GTPase MnmE [Wielerella bovis]ULJ64883.1 tRNA uridine-5-carboxymethylaminomethyl(34) synthesis GTPase MnmE [Wielerella bovis]ULJ67156.1 tRNA uridine-5-carboxymethylaminomethyl(34) synthesis GTPase MnmE [Wielerella bovis]ULJ69455.1 tRNA uridine-5-carboxymethylaminomethyl(34) synthesis GTPase MnmE [Wielerella bovis]
MLSTNTAKSPTIAAIATANGRGGVGVIRISGKDLLPFAQAISGGKTPKPRTALYTDFLAADGSAIDNGLLLYFAAPASFTGEDVIELQGHGGQIVLQMLLQRCLELGARIAEAGEFTKRAFLNNKMDLAQAESVADLIDASSQSAARMALRSLKGVFSQQIHQLVDDLITLRMLVEATLDFPEEEIDFLQAADAKGKLGSLQTQLAHILANAQQGAILREGMNVVLVGAPNVGKSSLLNALAGDDVAIVTDIAGTTRDTVREHITLDGVPIHITDTAGLRQTDDIVEKIGIERSEKAVQNADVALVLIDPDEGLNDTTRDILFRLPENLKRIEIQNKIDLKNETAQRLDNLSGSLKSGADTLIKLSAKTGAGLDLLKTALLQQIGWQGESEGLFLARTRHIHALQAAQTELDNAAMCGNHQLELLAEHLRLAQVACSQITGEFTADDLLGVIFSRFCIGK